MLKHIVMWKLKESANGKTKEENALLLKEKLEALVGEIAELRSLEVGINAIESDASYDIVLTTTFDNEADLKSYAVNPKHVLVSDFCSSIRESRVVVDYLI
ncbi:MAG: Dabb family protein [Paludibacteraceae bacterium]|nr:Dabb family protein [Paludibacteraceae bacterium]MBO7315866.1 Dabb family protein [Paludibacteraceae bacterium]